MFKDLATTVLLAADKDIILVPAMNVRMWLHKATQSNLNFTRLWLSVYRPEKGEMACGEFGEGKTSPRQIFAYLKIILIKEILLRREI